MSAPRITLRRRDIDYLHSEFPVAAVKVLVAEEDWAPFMAVACPGMEIPVLVEGEPGAVLVSVLHSADERDQSITVVI